MDALSISRRTAGLQIPIARIQSLARVVSQMVDEMVGIENEVHRELASHITNFADLIFDLATQTGKEAEGIERDATKQEKGR